MHILYSETCIKRLLLRQRKIEFVSTEGRVPVHCFAGKPIMLRKRPCAALTWMKSYLNDRTQRVAVGSVVSNSMHLQCGVPQSYVLAPRLYCIFTYKLILSLRTLPDSV